jgi:hypothetical protein
MVHDVMRRGECAVVHCGAQHKWDKWCALWWLWCANVVLWCAVLAVIFQLILPPFWCCFGGAGRHGYTFFRLRRLQIISQEADNLRVVKKYVTILFFRAKTFFL